MSPVRSSMSISMAASGALCPVPPSTSGYLKLNAKITDDPVIQARHQDLTGHCIRSFYRRFAHQTANHVCRPLLVGHRLAGRVRESHSRGQQLLVELLADVRWEGQQVVAEIIGNDLQGDDLDEVLAELVLLDLRDELDDS